jgi:hypothetical protein
LRLLALIFFASALLCRGAESAAGRWEGPAQVHGRELKLIVDLSEEAGKGWIGSIIIPGLAIKGAPLVDRKASGPDLVFEIKGALGSEKVGPAEIQAHLTADNRLEGNFKQGGNTAPFVLEKTGPAQVELPPRNTAVSKELEGEWKGEYELMGYARQVTMKFSNRGPEGAGLEFVIVGKKTNNVPVSLVTQEGDFLTIKSTEFGMTYEGRFRKESREINGTLTQGPFEVPLVMRRTP